MTIHDFIKILPKSKRITLTNDSTTYNVGHLLMTSRNHTSLLDQEIDTVEDFKEVVVIRTRAKIVECLCPNCGFRMVDENG